MGKHFNSMTPAQAERLALLSEEMGEVQQAIGKILRHGYESRNPTKRKSPTNRETFTKELGDLRAAISLVLKSGDVDGVAVSEQTCLKLMKVAKWMHHQPKSLVGEKP